MILPFDSSFRNFESCSKLQLILKNILNNVLRCLSNACTLLKYFASNMIQETNENKEAIC